MASHRIHRFWAKRFVEENGLSCSPEVLERSIVDLLIDCPQNFCRRKGLAENSMAKQPKWCSKPQYKPSSIYLERLVLWDKYCRDKYLRCLQEKQSQEGLSYREARNACSAYKLLPKVGIDLPCFLLHDLKIEKFGKRCGAANGYLVLARVLASLVCTEPSKDSLCTNETILQQDTCCKYLVDLHVVLDLVDKDICRDFHGCLEWSKNCATLYDEVLDFVKKHWDEILATIHSKH